MSLLARDGTVVAARTNEFSGLDQQMGLRLFHRGRHYEARTPAGSGKTWVGKHGFLSQTAFGQPYGPDGMNEAGLYCGMFMLTGGTGDLSTEAFDQAKLGRCVSVGDFMQWTLSSFTTVAQVREQLALPAEQRDFIIMDMADPAFGEAKVSLHFHWKFQDKTGDSFVLEVVNGGELKVYNTTSLHGVVTNSPTYDFHLRNIESYAHLEHEPVTFAEDGAQGRRFAYGLPGDFKSPSRFVRALHYARTVRPLQDGLDAIRESFRILNNFDLPLGAAVPHDQHTPGLLGCTQVTSACDVTNTVYYYKTMKNHRIRKLDLASIDWASLAEDVAFPMDEVEEEDFQVVSPAAPRSRL